MPVGTLISVHEYLENETLFNSIRVEVSAVFGTKESGSASCS